VLAALALGIGYVMQQRVAATMSMAEILRVRLLLDLMRLPRWWIGIGFMVAGQILSAFALQLATVAVVEPLLSASLLFALAASALAARKRVTWQEIVGALSVSAALAVFIAVCDPHSSPAPDSDLVAIVAAVAGVVVAVLVLVAIAKRRGEVGESVLIATAAGILYGLQDASTRAAFLRIDRHGLATLPVNPWMYIVVGSAAVAILLSQSAFKVARLDYSLPPIAAAEPLAGIILGVSLLGDAFSVSLASLVVLPFCVIAMIAGAALIGRSPNLAARPSFD
jgi:drug/metabolite transporter (DMT)-like permease